MDTNRGLGKRLFHKKHKPAECEKRLRTGGVPLLELSSALKPFDSLSADLIRNITNFLDIRSLLRVREVNSSFRDLASQSDAGWQNLVQRLWSDKIHVLPHARDHHDCMTAYRISIQDAKDRQFLLPEEVIFDPATGKGTVWSFRFKETAGEDWTSWDPWYKGEPCRKMVFLADGSVKQYSEPNPKEHPNERDQTATTTTRFQLQDPFRGGRNGGPMSPAAMLSWRYVDQPLDMASKPQGTYIRFTVGGRDVPTYCVRRSPTKNWGFIMESCWGVYASFDLPPRSLHARRRPLRARRTDDQFGTAHHFMVEVNDDSDSETERGPNAEQSSPAEVSRILTDDTDFVITSSEQWREAFLYNFGARTLPEGSNAAAEFQTMYEHVHEG